MTKRLPQACAYLRSVANEREWFSRRIEASRPDTALLVVPMRAATYARELADFSWMSDRASAQRAKSGSMPHGLIVSVKPIQNRQRLFHISGCRHRPEVIFGIPCRQCPRTQFLDQFVRAEPPAARQ